MRKVLLASPRGFCAGVERALKTVDDALKTGPFPVYVLHEIVHNENVVESLRKRGVIFIENPKEASGGGTLIFSAHGVSREVEEQAALLKVRVIDAACPIVKSLQRRIEAFEAEGREIILFGKEGHREVEGLLGRVHSTVHVMDSEEALDSFLAGADPSKCYACLSQTTLNADDVARMGQRLKEKLPHLTFAAEVCFATRDRQQAVKELAEKCDVILVVGSEKSSNTKRLYETAASCGVRAYLLSDAGGFTPSMIGGAECVGITSGASAPEELVRELLETVERCP